MGQYLGRAVVLAVIVFSSAVRAGGEIYGTVTTTRGDTFTGPIRWDSQENFWSDTLDGRKPVSSAEPDADDGFRFSLFGWELINTKSNSRTYPEFSVPFGYLKAVVPGGSGSVLLELKDGTRLTVEGPSTDFAGDLELAIDDIEEGRVVLPWRGIARVEFAQGPGQGRDRERLYGTVKTETREFTGFVVWDRDESLLDDVLDGEERGREREIAMGEIASIEPDGASAAIVRTKAGAELRLSGTNDVNDDMRGVIVTLDGVGRVEVGWDELKRVDFREAPTSPRYAAFDGGKRLRGTVHERDGRAYSGAITWDMDESYTWEFLDGESDRVVYAVPLSHVRSIAPVGDRSAEVVLADGKILRLSGTNDVDERNKGVMITAADGSETILDWSAIERVEFD
ncbi:MAG TPA: hypothetical protein VD788_08500 [Candidatus Polarisedimenticolaceae bacterium]|nr:hypothetical protein [Candidatus Polarisedimenticolaceae bacterium]